VAKTGQHGFAKRQREQKKAEKAAQKRAKREQRANPSEVIDDASEPSAELDASSTDTPMAPEANDVTEDTTASEVGSDSPD